MFAKNFSSDLTVTSYREALESYRDDADNAWGYTPQEWPAMAVGPDGQTVSVESQKHAVWVRNDGPRIIGSVGSDRPIVPVSSDPICEIMDTVIEATQAKIVKVGTLKGGAQQFLQAKMAEPLALKQRNGSDLSNGEVDTLWTLLTSHDGSMRLCIGGTSTVIICENTAAMAAKDAMQYLQMKHTKHSQAKFNDPEKIAQGLLAYRASVESTAVKLIENSFTDAMLDRAMRQVLGVPQDQAWGDIATRTKNTMEAIKDHAEGGIGIDHTNRGTAWGAFNAFTQYASHDIGVRVTLPEGMDSRSGLATAYRSDAESKARFESNLLGAGASFTNNALIAINDQLAA